MLEITRLGTQCCGCSACNAVCPTGAITMKQDPAGFFYPQWNQDKCINCAKCDNVCPVLFARDDSNDEAGQLYWAQANNPEILQNSSSGAVFFGLASSFLCEGGVVSGAVFGEDYRDVSHVLIDSVNKLKPLMRSKYVQSYIPKKVYRDILDRARAREKVLFSGTPCQAAAVRRLFEATETDQSMLFVTDIVCHGVPSRKLWSLWLDERCKGGTCEGINFRNKKDGWKKYSISYLTEDGERIVPRAKDWFMRAFLLNYSLRPACFSCPFKHCYLSDCTLADFWGFDSPDLEDTVDLGVSAVIARTEKGEECLDKIGDSYKTGKGDMAGFSLHNPAFHTVPLKPKDYEAFMRVLSKASRVAPVLERWPLKRNLKYFVETASRMFRGYLSR